MDTSPRYHDRPSAAAWGSALVLSLAALVAALPAGCAAGRIVGGAYVNPAAGIRLPVPGPPWTPMNLPDVEIAFRHPTSGTIALFTSCDDLENNGPLRILARHLFFGLKDLHYLEQAPVALDGAEALRTVARGSLEGQPVMVDSLVLRRGVCVADLVLTAPAGAFATLRPDFERVIAGLTEPRIER